MKFFKNQRGDTILEVLIVVAVLSLVLTVSFATVNRNTQGNRQAQERGEASKHTETQIELLKRYVAQTSRPELPADGSNFCMKNDGTPSGPITGIPSDAQGEITNDFNSFQAAGLGDCKTGEYYYTYVNRNDNTFTAHTRWYKVGGNGVDEVTMVHRVYPNLAGANLEDINDTTGCPPNQYIAAAGVCIACPLATPLSPGGTGGIGSCISIQPPDIEECESSADGIFGGTGDADEGDPCGPPTTN